MTRGVVGLLVAASMLTVAVADAHGATTYYQAVDAAGSDAVSSNGYWDVFLNPLGQVTSVNCGGECDGPRGAAWSESTNTAVDVGSKVFGCLFEDCFWTTTSINGSNQISGWIQGYTAACNGADQAFEANIATNTYSLMRCNSDAYFVNAAGQLVGGYVNGRGVERAFLWDGKTFKDLGTLGGAQAFATGSAATNQAVGCSQTKSGAWHPFLYKNGTMTDLGLPTGFSDGCAYAVNANGLILGGDGVTPQSGYGGNFGQCRLWTRSAIGTFTIIKPPAGAGCLSGQHIDLNGVVAFTAYTTSWGGYLWKAGHLTKLTGANVPFGDLDTISGLISTPVLDGASSSNLHGQVAVDVAEFGSDLSATVLLTPLKIYNDTNSAIIYSPAGGGNQSELAVSGAWANNLHYWAYGGYTATLKFTGKSVRMVGEIGPGLDTASVALDGVNRGTVSETASNTAQRQTIFQYSWPTSGTHTIKITTAGPFTLDALATTKY